MKNTKWLKKFLPETVVFLVTTLFFSPIIRFLGFRLNDDFHFIRSYSLAELTQSWYSNWNFTGFEADGYRPLIIWTNHMLHALLGFNDIRFMIFIALLNSTLAVIFYRLALQFLSKPYAMCAALLTILVPQTLFKLTWSTEIASSIAFGAMAAGSLFLIKWFKTENNRYIVYAIVLGVIAALYKETSYPLLICIPIVIFLQRLTVKKYSILKILKDKYLWLSTLIFLGLIVIRYFALQVYPERMNEAYVQFMFKPSFEFLGLMLSGINRELVILIIPFLTTVASIFEWSKIYDASLIFCFMLLGAVILFNQTKIKNPFIFIFSLTLIIINFFTFTIFLFSDIGNSHTIVTLLTPVIIFGSYFVTFTFLWFVLQNKYYSHYALLFILFLFTTIPLIFGSFYRLRILTFLFASVLFMIVYQQLSKILFRFKQNSIHWSLLIPVCIIFVFGIRVFWYGVENNKLLNKPLYNNILNSERWKELDKKFEIKNQINYAQNMYDRSTQHEKDLVNSMKIVESEVLIQNGSFEEEFNGWEVIDCSPGKEGLASGSADLSDVSVHGNKSLYIKSENHILCANTRIVNTRKGSIYSISYFVKFLESRRNAEVADAEGIVKSYLFTSPSDNGWYRQRLFFKALGTTSSLILISDPYVDYTSANPPGIQEIFFDDISIQEVELDQHKLDFGFLSVPDWIGLKMFEAPFH